MIAAWAPSHPGLRPPGLPLVMYRRHLDHARDGDIMYAPDAAAARDALATGVRWRAAICGRDEPNVTGPSGPRLTPAEYRASFEGAALLMREAGVPVSTAGLGTVGEGLCRRGRHDDQYVLPVADARSWNATGARKRTIIETITNGKWILSPAPSLPWTARTYDWVIENTVGTSARDWLDISLHPNVIAVAFWCLAQLPNQRSMGLLLPDGRRTWLGRRLLEAR